MKRPGCAALTAALFGSTTGCGSGGGSDATIVQVSPTAAFSDAPFSLTIGGVGFRPAYQIDTVSGSAENDTGGFTAFLAPPLGSTLARVEATGLAWQTMVQIVAQFPAGIPAGSYDVGVHDPRGQDIVKPQAFTSLGPDLMAPSITIQQPAEGDLYGAGAPVNVVFFADDGVGAVATLGWKVSTAEGAVDAGSCPIASASGPQVCRFTFTAPTPPNGLEALDVDVNAVDDASNLATAHIVLALAPAPTVTSVAPRIGPTSGGFEIDVQGSDFVSPTGGPGTGTQILIGGQPISTNVVSSTQLVGFCYGHDPGDAPLSVSTGYAETPAGIFTFVAPAVVRLVSPATGPTWGGTPVAVVGDNFRDGGTTILVGGIPLGCQRFVSANRIEGLTPATPSGQALAVAVAASDPIVDGTMLQGGFTYYVDDSDGGQPPDGGCGGDGP
jgi:hypothetical protein